MEAVLTWIINNWPYLALLLLCVGFAIYATIKVSTFYHTRFTPLEKGIHDIKGSVDRIEKYLINENPKSAYPALVQSHSPKTLTEIGNSLLTECGGRKFVDENQDVLLGDIINGAPVSPLDVEKLAIEVLLKFSESPGFIQIKDFIYNNPSYKEVSVQLYSIINIMSVYLRDKYFERFPGSRESASP